MPPHYGPARPESGPTEEERPELHGLGVPDTSPASQVVGLTYEPGDRRRGLLHALFVLTNLPRVPVSGLTDPYQM
ncbi:hypothetical protein ACVV2G_30975 [Streptomyces ziwulingensis]